MPYRPKRVTRTAIAIAKGQGTRSFELLAALSLARLYQSTGRPADAHAVLAPALEGFAATPEMPEIAEAQALLAALAETDEVKSEAARRRRDAQLHVAYGNALIPARGYGAPETAEAFAAAREQADGDNAAPERLAADMASGRAATLRGELPSMQSVRRGLPRRRQGRDPNSPEAGVAHRAAGLTCWFAGEYCRGAVSFGTCALIVRTRPRRRSGLSLRPGPWRRRDDRSRVCVVASRRGRLRPFAHRPHADADIAPHQCRHDRVWRNARGPVRIDARRQGDAPRPRLELSRLVREHELMMYQRVQCVFRGLGDRRDGRARARGHAGRQWNFWVSRTFCFRWAIEDRAGRGGGSRGRSRPRHRDPRRSVGDADRIGHRAFEAELHRARGEILLKRDPEIPRPPKRRSKRAIVVSRAARNAQLRTARRAFAGQALPVDWPPRRRPRRPRARARRLFADAGNAGDRRGAGAARGAGGDWTRSGPTKSSDAG